MKKHIGFFAHGPGSANALFPIIQKMKDEYHLSLFAFHPFVSELWGVEAQKELSLEQIDFSLFDLVVYGTGSLHEIERFVPFYAKEKQVPSLSILDIFWGGDDDLKLRYFHPPDYLIVPNRETKKQIQSLHIMPSEHIFVFGNPHFDRLKKYDSIPRRLSFPLDIVCFSQPSNHDSFSETNQLVQKMVRSIAVLCYSKPEMIQNLYITPHPREDDTWLKEFVKPYDFMKLESYSNSFSLLLSCDLNVGVNCTLQYEGMMVGKPTIFYQNTKQFLMDLTQLHVSNIKTKMSFSATESTVQWIKHFLNEKG